MVDTGTGNALLSNLIYDNTAGGISLLNGGNNNQVAPVLTAAKSAVNVINVVGSLAVKAGTSYLVQYFANNPASDQGRTLLGSQAVSQQPSGGSVPLSFVTAVALPAGSTITAIASVTMAPSGSVNPATGDTSAFSTAAIVVVINPFIVTNTTDSTTNPQVGSLRLAIEAASSDVANNDTILFEIPTTDPNYNASTGSWTIRLLAGLTIDKPESGGIQYTVFVDALSQQSQPGSATTHPVIAIDPGPGFVGTALTLSSGGNTVSGLVVQGFPGDGVDVNSSASGNTIVDNFIGTNVLGASSVGNAGAGISIASYSNTIAHDLISGNTMEGIFITGGSNSVLDNLIGTNAAGTAALGNGAQGIILENTTHNVLSGNVISGNSSDGIELDPDASQNLIVGNIIGANAARTVALPNMGDGVHLFGSANTVGGTTAGAGNTIAFNKGNGVVVDTGSGNGVLSNSIYNNTVGGIALVNGGNNNQPAPVTDQFHVGLEQDQGGWFARRQGGDELPHSVLQQQPGFQSGADSPGQPGGQSATIGGHGPAQLRRDSDASCRLDDHGNRQRHDGPARLNQPGDR